MSRAREFSIAPTPRAPARGEHDMLRRFQYSPPPFLCAPLPPFFLQAFVEHYYNTFDTNRAALATLYQVGPQGCFMFPQ